MFKGIATAAFGFGAIMTVAVVVSQLSSTGSTFVPNTTIVKKNLVFPLKGQLALEPCAISYCANI